jgi:hypothetical protein
MKKKSKQLIINICILSILFISLLNTTTISTTKDAHTMNKQLSSIISELVPADHDFLLAFDENTQRALQKKMIMIFDTDGIALIAPDTINLNLHSKVPLLWLQLSSALRNWQVEEKRNTFLIISDLISNTISIKYAYAGRPKRFDFRSIPKSSEGLPPPSPQDLGFTSSEELLNCKAIMGNQPLKPTTLAITMTQYDWVSNTVQINMIDTTGGTPQIPVIPESVSRQIYNGYKAAAKNMKDSAVFSPSLKPPANTQNGILAVVPEKVSNKDSRWMMHGSIRVPVSQGAIVATGEQEKLSETPSAIITALVIVNKLDNKEPSWITLKLPVLTKCKVKDPADVSFSVDLKRFKAQFSEPGVYQVFIACEAFVSGPFALEVTE